MTRLGLGLAVYLRRLQLGKLHFITLLAANSFVAIFIGELAIGELNWPSAENSL